MIKGLYHIEDDLFKEISTKINFLDKESKINNSYFGKKLVNLAILLSISCTISSTGVLFYSLSTSFKSILLCSLSPLFWLAYWYLLIRDYHLKDSQEIVQFSLITNLINLAADIFNSTLDLNSKINTDLEFPSRFLSFLWSIPEYTCLALLLILIILNLYLKDQLKLKENVEKDFLNACTKTEDMQKVYINNEVQIIKVFVEELRTIVSVIQEHTKTLSLFGESNILESNNCKVFELKLETFFTHFSKICNVLTTYREINSGQFLGFVASYKSKNKFEITNVLQLCGDILGKHAAREKLELIINDVELIFKKLHAYGEGIALNHIMVRMLNFAIQSALPNSSIEIGVKIPTFQKSENGDFAAPISVVFFVTYTTSSSTDIIDLNLDADSPLVKLSKDVGAKLTYFGESDKKTIYVNCSFVLPEECHSILRKSFEDNIIEHYTRKLFLERDIYLISPSDSTFGEHMNNCFKLLGANVTMVQSSVQALSRLLKKINEKSVSYKEICYIVNESFQSFQAIIHDILLRNTGDHARRSNNASIIYILSPEKFPEVFQFLEATLSQCHSSFYPCITLIPKPVGFRLFVDLFTSHVNTTQTHFNPGRFRSLSDVKQHSNCKVNSPEINSPRVPHSPRALHKHNTSNGSNGHGKPETLKDIKAEPDLITIPPTKKISSPMTSPLPNVVVTQEKSEPIPLSKLLPKSKQARTAAKQAKLKSSLGKKQSPASLSPSSQPNNRSVNGSYFPQVQSLPINVLIVEDNPINQKILATFMKKRNIKYAVANDGQEAVEKWKKGGFHIVLMDIQLPVMDGIEATKEIRSIEKRRQISFFSPQGQTSNEPMKLPSHSQPNTPSPRTPPTPIQSPVIIVALTASSLRTDRVDALAAGCNDFLTKPVSLVWLEKKIMEWGCMQALIDIEGWRRLKYTKAGSPNSRSTGSSYASTHHNFPMSNLPDPTQNFNMRSEAMLSKLKKAEEKRRGNSPSPSNH